MTSLCVDTMPDAVRYDIEHVSRYLYASSVRHSVMSLCMKPSDGSRQRLLRFDVTTVPPSSLNAETDGFGNTKHVLNIHREAHEPGDRSPVPPSKQPPAAPLPDALGPGAWDDVRSRTGAFTHWGIHTSKRIRQAHSRSSCLNRPAGHRAD